METNLAYQETWREEIVGGEAVMTAPAASAHNRVKNNISEIFTHYLRSKPCEYLPDGEGLILAEGTDEYIPDGMVVCDPEKVRHDCVYGAPDLVIEVLSPGTAKNDRGRKKETYERCGVREFWIVDPANRVLEQYVPAAPGARNSRDAGEAPGAPDARRFTLREVYHKYSPLERKRMKREELDAIVTEFRCTLFDDLTIRVEDVFDRV